MWRNVHARLRLHRRLYTGVHGRRMRLERRLRWNLHTWKGLQRLLQAVLRRRYLW